MSENSTYTKPEQVNAPKGRWVLNDVLFDGGEGDWACASGTWDGSACIAIRYNGFNNDGTSNPPSPVGTPNARGYPTWFILPEPLHQPTLELVEIPEAKRRRAKALLGIE
jgi:hypothetical protein